MNAIQETSFRRSVAVLLCGSILLLAWPHATAAEFSRVGDERSLLTFTGEELFEGLLLGDGPVAALFPELWSEYAEQLSTSLSALAPAERHNITEALRSGRERILTSVRTMKPAFFGRFRTEVTSGDHVRIAAVLEEALAVLQSAVHAELERAGVPPDELESITEEAVTSELKLVLVVAVAGAFAVYTVTALATVSVTAATLFVALAIAAVWVAIVHRFVFLNKKQTTTQGSRLEWEVTVDQIARRLAGAKVALG